MNKGFEKGCDNIHDGLSTDFFVLLISELFVLVFRFYCAYLGGMGMKGGAVF